MINKNQVQKKKLSLWFVIPMILVFWPLGIYIMWKQQDFNKITRIIITVLAILITLLKLIGMS